MAETETGNEKVESKRGRVRRLLLDPLENDGFKRPHKISEEDFKKKLGRLADALAYMSDNSLQVLYNMMRSKGQGRERNVWPDRATFYAIAELVEPCPIEKIPSMLGWFASRSGPQAQADDTLVEVLGYIQQHKKPPTTDGARKQIAHDAQERRRFVQIARRRILDGEATDEEKARLAFLDGRQRLAESLVARGNRERPDDNVVHDDEVRP